MVEPTQNQNEDNESKEIKEMKRTFLTTCVMYVFAVICTLYSIFIYISVVIFPSLTVKLYSTFCVLINICSHFCWINIRISGDNLILRAFRPNIDTSCVIISNHRSMFDIITTFCISSEFDQPIGFCLKRVVSLLPGIGWWCKLLDYPIMDRNTSDHQTLKNTKYPILVIYPEGTRFTDKNHILSCKYASDHGLPIGLYSNLPRPTGAHILTRNRTVYFQTLTYFDSNGHVIKGEVVDFSTICVHFQKFDNVPSDEESFKCWIRQRFIDIDEMYDNGARTLAESTPLSPKVTYFQLAMFFLCLLFYIGLIWIIIVLRSVKWRTIWR